jgi:SWI/SNF-related matrix-associated actin-dependent regulator of chromatin subfamily A3
MVAGWLYQMILSPLCLLNITVLQESIESQAVDRVNRIGQKKAVHVYQLIAENTVESKVLDIQGKKKQLIQQVSSFRI